uniref:Uncharacterized protein n=1 Tax=Ulva sp. UNA00071828 TaxID=1641711 RepID=A0A0F6WVX2_9CHLO|nr:hypothetical protein [Ulva sp. UNA00071828]
MNGNKRAVFSKNITILIMLSETTLLQFADLSSLILIKLFTSLLYLVVNYITHKVTLPVTPANVLQLFISSLDFIILQILIAGYIFESCAMVYSFSILGILFFVFICFASWLTLVQNAEEVQAVLIINLFS